MLYPGALACFAFFAFFAAVMSHQILPVSAVLASDPCRSWDDDACWYLKFRKACMTPLDKLTPSELLWPFGEKHGPKELQPERDEREAQRSQLLERQAVIGQLQQIAAALHKRTSTENPKKTKAGSGNEDEEPEGAVLSRGHSLIAGGTSSSSTRAAAAAARRTKKGRSGVPRSAGAPSGTATGAPADRGTPPVTSAGASTQQLHPPSPDTSTSPQAPHRPPAAGGPTGFGFTDAVRRDLERGKRIHQPKNGIVHGEIQHACFLAVLDNGHRSVKEIWNVLEFQSPRTTLALHVEHAHLLLPELRRRFSAVVAPWWSVQESLLDQAAEVAELLDASIPYVKQWWLLLDGSFPEDLPRLHDALRAGAHAARKLARIVDRTKAKRESTASGAEAKASPSCSSTTTFGSRRSSLFLPPPREVEVEPSCPRPPHAGEEEKSQKLTLSRPPGDWALPPHTGGPSNNNQASASNICTRPRAETERAGDSVSGCRELEYGTQQNAPYTVSYDNNCVARGGPQCSHSHLLTPSCSTSMHYFYMGSPWVLHDQKEQQAVITPCAAGASTSLDDLVQHCQRERASYAEWAQSRLLSDVSGDESDHASRLMVHQMSHGKEFWGRGGRGEELRAKEEEKNLAASSFTYKNDAVEVDIHTDEGRCRSSRDWHSQGDRSFLQLQQDTFDNRLATVEDGSRDRSGVVDDEDLDSPSSCEGSTTSLSVQTTAPFSELPSNWSRQTSPENSELQL